LEKEKEELLDKINQDKTHATTKEQLLLKEKQDLLD